MNSVHNNKIINLEGYSSYCNERNSCFYLKSDLPVSDNRIFKIIKGNDNEIDAIKNQFDKLCLKVFRKKPLHISYLRDQGTFHYIFRLVLPDQKHYIIKTSIDAFPYRSYDFFIDRWIMGQMKLHNLPFLHIYDVDVSRSEFSFDYTIMDEASGSPLSTLSHDKKYNQHCLVEFGKILSSLHSIESVGYGPVDVHHIIKHDTSIGHFSAWTDYIYQNLEKDIEICFDKAAIDLKQKRFIQDVFSMMRYGIKESKCSLLHGDLGNQNIFINEGSISAIIDWEDCLSGDTIFDIASWGTFVGNHEQRNFVLEGYEMAGALPDDFEIRYWIYYLRIIIAKTVHRFRFGYHEKDRIPPAERIVKPLQELSKII